MSTERTRMFELINPDRTSALSQNCYLHVKILPRIPYQTIWRFIGSSRAVEWIGATM